MSLLSFQLFKLSSPDLFAHLREKNQHIGNPNKRLFQRGHFLSSVKGNIILEPDLHSSMKVLCLFQGLQMECLELFHSDQKRNGLKGKQP